MGKISIKDAEALQKSGILSKSALNEMHEKGLVSRKRDNAIRRFMKTNDGKWVEPMLYFRGSKNTTKSENMKFFINDFNVLLEKYTKIRDNKTK
jgi:hypothetical protein